MGLAPTGKRCHARRTPVSDSGVGSRFCIAAYSKFVIIEPVCLSSSEETFRELFLLKV
jgi:hypothetical protein